MAGETPQDLGHASPLQPRLDQEDLLEWAAWGDTPIVSTFGQPQLEYAAIRSGTGLMDLPQRSVLEFTGADRHVFLNNLLSNALLDRSKKPIPPGHGCYSFLLNLKGRIAADLRVLQVSEERTLVECQRAQAKMLLETFDAYLFADKVRIRDLGGELYSLALHGPGALELLESASDTGARFEPTDFPATFDLPTLRTTIGGVETFAWREDECGVPGVHLLVPRQHALRLWDDLITRFGQAEEQHPGRRRLRPVGWAMFNACRIEAGTPLLGIDFPPAPPSRPGQKAEQAGEGKGAALPAETGPLFEKAVSLSGGCYLGQEVVARMHARQALARRIVGIRMSEDALPAAGAEVEVSDQPAGVITSSTLSPVLSGACIALAMVKRPHFDVGTDVKVPAEGRRARGSVVELPFMR